MELILRCTVTFGLVLLVAEPARAAVDPAFDFTGHWTGYGQEGGRPQHAVAGDLTQEAGTRNFTGTVAVTDDPPFTCALSGKQKAHHMKVKILLDCDNGGKLKLHATLDALTASLTGGYRRRGNHQVRVGIFTLTRQPS